MSTWSLFGFFGRKKTSVKNNIFGLDADFTPNQYDYSTPFNDAYIKSSDVYALNKMIADSTKVIPWVLKKRTGERVDVINSGQLYDIINNPNQGQDIVQFKEECSLNYTLSGNLFLYPEVNALGFTRPTGIKSLHPQLVEIVIDDNAFYRKVKEYIYYANRSRKVIPADEIVHLKMYNPSDFGIHSLRGLSPITAAYLTVTGLIGNQTASASIYKHQGAAGILSNESDVILTQTQRDDQQQHIDKRLAGATLFGKIIQSNAKVKYTRLGLDPSQLKLIDSKVLKMRDLCNIYNTNSALLNDPDNKIYNSVVQAEKSFYTKAVIPNDTAILKAFENAILKKYNSIEFPSGKSMYYLEQDLSGIDALQDDASTKANRANQISTTIDRILKMPTGDEQKVASLVMSLGISIEEANKIVFGK